MMRRKLRLVIGIALVVLACWAAWFLNVDADVEPGPTNCGPNVFRVLADGPSRNQQTLSIGECRTAATINILTFGVLLALGVAIASGAFGRLVGRVVRRLTRWSERRDPHTPVGEVIPLKRLPLNWRPPHIEVGSGTVRIVAPQYFGRTALTVFTSDTVVAETSSIVDADGAGVPDLDERVFEQPVFLPFLTHTGEFVRPNLVLLFRRPARVPVLRRFVDRQRDVGFSRRETRSAHGAWVDGVLLRAEDPCAAVETLARNDVEVITAPDAWLLAHRATTSDPMVVATVKQELRRAARLDRAGFGVAFALFAIGLGLEVFGGSRLDGFSVAAYVLAATVFVAHQGYAYILNRRRKADQPPT